MTSGYLKESPADRLRGLVRYQYLFLALVIAVVLFDLIVVSYHQPLGTDDLMARISAQSPSLGRMLSLQREQPFNVDAPVFIVLEYYAARLPLPIDIAIRVPAMIAMCVALVAIFLLVRDWLGLGAAYVAVGLLATNSYTLYGAKARPYALLLAGVALAVLCWQRIVAGSPNRRFWLIAFGASAAFAWLSHYFALASLLAVVVAELARSLIRRKWDWPIWIALGVTALLYVPVYLAFAPAGLAYRPHPFDHLNRRDVLDSYRSTISLRAVTVLFVTVGLLAGIFGRPKRSRSLPVLDWTIAILLFLGPVFLYIAGKLYTLTYATRYGIGAVLGTVIILSAIAHWIAGGSAKVLVPAFLLSFAAYQPNFISLARQPAVSWSSPWAKATPALLQKYSDLPFITPDFDFWMRIKFYAPSWVSLPIIMVTNRESMIKFVGTQNPALSALAIHRWTGWPLADYYEFVRSHRQFLMYGDYWMWFALTADGAKIQFLDYVGPYRLYLVNLPPARND